MSKIGVVKVYVVYFSGDDSVILVGGWIKFVIEVLVDNIGMSVWSGLVIFKVNCKLEIGNWLFDN